VSTVALVMERAGNRVKVMAAVWACVSVLGAQAPALGDGKRLTLEVVVEHAGKQVPRIPELKPGEPPCPAFAIEGRRIAWRVGDTKLDDAAALAKELARLAKEPAMLVADPGPAGEKVPMPLVVTAPAAAYWRDVAEAVDAALSARFPDVQCEPSAAPFRPWWIAKSVADPVRAAHTVVVPKIIYNEPDDRATPGRPVVHVLQDGRVEIGGAMVFHPQKADGGKALREALERLARAGRERDGVRQFGQAKVELVDTHLLIHADQWAPWSSVRTVAHLATEIRPAFWRLEYAVTEADYEAFMRRGQRFPDRRARPRGDGR
jgi:hypothetical protein